MSSLTPPIFSPLAYTVDQGKRFNCMQDHLKIDFYPDSLPHSAVFFLHAESAQTKQGIMFKDSQFVAAAIDINPHISLNKQNNLYFTAPLLIQNSKNDSKSLTNQ